MFRLFRWLFTGDGHLHKWTIIKEVNVCRDNRISHTRYYAQCLHCGKIKVTDQE